MQLLAAVGNICIENAPTRCKIWTRGVSFVSYSDAGWSSSVARRAHNPKVAGSNPAPATNVMPAQRPFLVHQEGPLALSMYQGCTTPSANLGSERSNGTPLRASVALRCRPVGGRERDGQRPSQRGACVGRVARLRRARHTLGVTERFVRRLVEERRIPHFKLGPMVRFDPDEVDRWVQACRVQPGAVEPLSRRGRRRRRRR